MRSLPVASARSIISPCRRTTALRCATVLPISAAIAALLSVTVVVPAARAADLYLYPGSPDSTTITSNYNAVYVGQNEDSSITGPVTATILGPAIIDSLLVSNGSTVDVTDGGKIEYVKPQPPVGLPAPTTLYGAALDSSTLNLTNGGLISVTDSQATTTPGDVNYTASIVGVLAGGSTVHVTGPDSTITAQGSVGIVAEGVAGTSAQGSASAYVNGVALLSAGPAASTFDATKILAIAQAQAGGDSDSDSSAGADAHADASALTTYGGEVNLTGDTLLSATASAVTQITGESTGLGWTDATAVALRMDFDSVVNVEAGATISFTATATSDSSLAVGDGTTAVAHAAGIEAGSDDADLEIVGNTLFNVTATARSGSGAVGDVGPLPDGTEPLDSAEAIAHGIKGFSSFGELSGSTIALIGTNSDISSILAEAFGQGDGPTDGGGTVGSTVFAGASGISAGVFNEVTLSGQTLDVKATGDTGIAAGKTDLLGYAQVNAIGIDLDFANDVTLDNGAQLKVTAVGNAGEDVDLEADGIHAYETNVSLAQGAKIDVQGNATGANGYASAFGSGATTDSAQVTLDSSSIVVSLSATGNLSDFTFPDADAVAYGSGIDADDSLVGLTGASTIQTTVSATNTSGGADAQSDGIVAIGSFNAAYVYGLTTKDSGDVAQTIGITSSASATATAGDPSSYRAEAQSWGIYHEFGVIGIDGAGAFTIQSTATATGNDVSAEAVAHGIETYDSLVQLNSSSASLVQATATATVNSTSPGAIGNAEAYSMYGGVTDISVGGAVQVAATSQTAGGGLALSSAYAITTESADSISLVQVPPAAGADRLTVSASASAISSATDGNAYAISMGVFANTDADPSTGFDTITVSGAKVTATATAGGTGSAYRSNAIAYALNVGNATALTLDKGAELGVGASAGSLGVGNTALALGTGLMAGSVTDVTLDSASIAVSSSAVGDDGASAIAVGNGVSLGATNSALLSGGGIGTTGVAQALSSTGGDATALVTSLLLRDNTAQIDGDMTVQASAFANAANGDAIATATGVEVDNANLTIGNSIITATASASGTGQVIADSVGLYAHNGSTVTIDGAADISHDAANTGYGIFADNSTINLVNGTVDTLAATGTTSVFMSGGFLDELFLFDTSSLLMTGGTISSSTIYELSASDAAFGFSSYSLLDRSDLGTTYIDQNGNVYSGLYHQVIGSFYNGGSLNTVLFDATEVTYAGGGTALLPGTLVVVPEAGTGLLFALAGLALAPVIARRKRRMPVA